MTREHDLRDPRCENPWRLSEWPFSPQTGDPRRQQRPLLQSDLTSRNPQTNSSQPSRAGHGLLVSSTQPYAQRSTPAAIATTSEPGGSQGFKNPNLIPVVPRRKQSTTTMSREAGQQQGDELEDERLPQIWNPSIDNLITRTAHDYDMVMNYQRDAEGGQRWMPEDIVTIRNVGRYLHRDIFALRRWRRVVAEEGDQDKNMMIQIKRDANLLKLQCERVQRAINKYEQKCEFQLLRDGVYAQDEDGNFYKPTAPQEYVAEGGYLQDVARPSIKTTKDHTWNHQSDRDQSAHYSEDHHDNPHANMSRCQTTTESQPPKRNFAFDFASQENPFDRSKRGAPSQTAPSRRDRSDRVQDGRVSKSYRDLPSGKTATSTKNETRTDTVSSEAPRTIPRIR